MARLSPAEKTARIACVSQKTAERTEERARQQQAREEKSRYAKARSDARRQYGAYLRKINKEASKAKGNEVRIDVGTFRGQHETHYYLTVFAEELCELLRKAGYHASWSKAYTPVSDEGYGDETDVIITVSWPVAAH